MGQPTVFIGSSTEQLPTARALAKRLKDFSAPVVWDEAPFQLNAAILEGLLKAAQETDYAVFVFEPDDVTRIRSTDARTVRDNVLFEFGLFVGRIGPGRTFWISSNESDGHLPADLVGLTHLVFQRPASSESVALEGALSHATARLRDVISTQGRRTDRDIEELESVRALCVASSEYDKTRFAEAITK